VAKLLTTTEAAQRVGIDRVTLQKWIRTHRVKPPETVLRNGRSVRLWSPRDVERLREVKARTYRRGRGRQRTPGGRKNRRRRASTNPSGRPADIDVRALVSYRDQFLGLLTQAWGDVGWDLPRVSTVEELRRALGPLSDVTLPWFRLTPFLQDTTTAVTRSDLRRARQAHRAFSNRSGAALSERQTTLDRFKESEGALRDAPDIHGESLRAEHFRRLFLCICAECEWRALRDTQAAEDAVLGNQIAFYAQHELLTFVRSSRRYARNPPNLAAAMAGPPDVSASYAFQRCAAQPNPSWPFIDFRIFELIEAAWSQVGSVPTEALFDALRLAIRALPPDDPVRRQLVSEWRYLRLATEDVITSIAADRAAVPFRVYATYRKKRTTPQTREEAVRMQMERLEPPG
jgi:hypothetical protein